MKCDGGSHPDESSCCSLTETCDALRLTLEGYSRGQQEKLQHVSDLFSLAEIMGCQRKWMFGWMIVTFTQERSAGLSCSFSSNTLSHTHRKPCEWTCHRCSSVKTSRVWVPPTSWRLAAVSKAACLSAVCLSEFNTGLILSFLYVHECVSVLMPAHTLLHLTLSSVSPHVASCVNVFSVNPNVSPRVVFLTFCVTLWSWRCLGALLEERVQRWRGDDVTAFTRQRAGSEAQHQRDKEPSPWLAHWRLPGARQVHSHILQRKWTVHTQYTHTHTHTHTQRYTDIQRDMNQGRAQALKIDKHLNFIDCVPSSAPLRMSRHVKSPPQEQQELRARVCSAEHFWWWTDFCHVTHVSETKPTRVKAGNSPVFSHSDLSEQCHLCLHTCSRCFLWFGPQLSGRTLHVGNSPRGRWHLTHQAKIRT